MGLCEGAKLENSTKNDTTAQLPTRLRPTVPYRAVRYAALLCRHRRRDAAAPPASHPGRPTQAQNTKLACATPARAAHCAQTALVFCVLQYTRDSGHLQFDNRQQLFAFYARNSLRLQLHPSASFPSAAIRRLLLQTSLRKGSFLAVMSKEVAESCFAMLHMEMVALAAGDDVAEATPAQLQVAARRLESAGFEVGLRLVERHSKDRARFADTLDIIKFICKDFWYEVYRKQIDKLQTNNRVRIRPLSVC
eukprot:4336416-Pleurochrysis_carterae.AAC.2